METEQMIENRWRICMVAFLMCASLALSGCFFAVYPQTYDASGFETFQYRVVSDLQPCAVLVNDDVFEATITKEANGEYVAWLGVCSSPLLSPRVMTESEVERMLALFSELRINLHPRPFCTLFTFSPSITELSILWDDFELVVVDCDQARIDWKQSHQITFFLQSLIPDDLEADEATVP